MRNFNTRRLSGVLGLLSSEQPKCPQLYIYSSADRVIPVKSVESFIEEQRRAGHEVRACDFISSPHVDHFRNDPKLYTSQLTSFLEDTVLNSCKVSSWTSVIYAIFWISSRTWEVILNQVYNFKNFLLQKFMILSLSIHLIIWMETCISQVSRVIMIRLIEKYTFLYWIFICGLVSLRPHPIAYPFCCAALLYSVFHFFNVSINVTDEKERPHCIQSRARQSLDSQIYNPSYNLKKFQVDSQNEKLFMGFSIWSGLF